MQKLDRILSKIGALPALSPIVNKLLQLLENDNSSVDEIARLIAVDQAFSVKVLRFANSAYFGFAREIASIQQAIVILGTRSIKNIALGISVFHIEYDTQSSFQKEIVELEKRSVKCAVYAQEIARFLHFPHLDDVFVAGLLHDVGRLIVMKFLDEEYERILEKTADGTVSMLDAEQEILGFTHMELGAYILDQWNFPQNITSVIQYHHIPHCAPSLIADNPTVYSLIKIIALTQLICTPRQLSADELGIQTLLLEDLKLSLEDLELLFENGEVELQLLTAAFD